MLFLKNRSTDTLLNVKLTLYDPVAEMDAEFETIDLEGVIPSPSY